MNSLINYISENQSLIQGFQTSCLVSGSDNYSTDVTCNSLLLSCEKIKWTFPPQIYGLDHIFCFIYHECQLDMQQSLVSSCLSLESHLMNICSTSRSCTSLVMDLLEEKWVSKPFSRMISEVANTADRGADVFLQGTTKRRFMLLYRTSQLFQSYSG